MNVGLFKINGRKDKGMLVAVEGGKLLDGANIQSTWHL